LVPGEPTAALARKVCGCGGARSRETRSIGERVQTAVARGHGRHGGVQWMAALAREVRGELAAARARAKAR